MILQQDRWVYEDKHGVRMPWYTYPCLKWLDTLDLSMMDVFEYGLGYSTLWYRSRGAIACGVESNPDWYASVESHLNLLTQNKERYTKFILEFHEFDIVVIDGIWRDDCTEFALRRLKKGGYLICDNWLQPDVEPDWPKTQAYTQHLNGKIYRQEDHEDWVTAVWQV